MYLSIQMMPKIVGIRKGERRPSPFPKFLAMIVSVHYNVFYMPALHCQQVSHEAKQSNPQPRKAMIQSINVQSDS